MRIIRKIPSNKLGNVDFYDRKSTLCANEHIAFHSINDKVFSQSINAYSLNCTNNCSQMVRITVKMFLLLIENRLAHWLYSSILLKHILVHMRAYSFFSSFAIDLLKIEVHCTNSIKKWVDTTD